MDLRVVLDILLQHLAETTLERNQARAEVARLNAALEDAKKPKPRAKK